MRILKQTSQFKKDLKRIQNNPKKVAGMEVVLRLLKETGILLSKYKPHLLKNYKGYMECHREGDFCLFGLMRVRM